MNKFVSLAALSALLTIVTTAAGTVTEPNGAVYPVDSNNGEIQLYTFFQQRGEAIDYKLDGQSTPSTFSPLCDFKATFVLNQAGSHFGVGWYNAPAASLPQPGTDIHVIMPPNSPVGTVITAASIRNDPAYAGGTIGFALLGGQTHFSEPQWNQPYYANNPATPWILAVIYASKVTPNAYYLAFEDGNVKAFTFGNDGDYNDDVFFFEGLVCSGGGAACDTGQPGVCAAGLTQCDGTTCKPITSPGAEQCNGLDDDCNGQVDEGDLCQAGYVCDKGTCVKACGGGEFQCPTGKVCSTDGYCVDADCAAVTCNAGQVCVHGTCKAPCDAVTCPAGQVCRVGQCVDPCAGVSCAQGQVCVDGVCRSSCACAPCAAGLSCENVTGLCKTASCVAIQCPAGSHCDSGQCVDSCAGAVCPSGQKCNTGQCVDDADAGAGTGGSGGSAGGLSFGGTGGTLGGTGGTAASAASGGADAGGGTSGTGPPRGSTSSNAAGCSCRTPAGDDSRSSAALALLGLAWLASRRRRRR